MASGVKKTQSLGRLVLEHTENLPKTKSLGPVPPVRNAQADLGRFFSEMQRVSLINILFHSIRYYWLLLGVPLTGI